ncbi:MAG TPA: pyridoxamine 5'-phosphate oxidase [Pirellulaceae bacterium]|nr:pyridoxamine 5'-phosphate oxidase [Pirellulaceae bacterium]HMO92845.1 pyridoxamine 5'-phosphate oxidase [Pirellulaceae bacterium]HMP69413.1 pyridoxamine 5'-phosphate oxidase [Pirellulaceae bacterium]
MSIYDKIRREYEDQGLDLNTMAACPFAEFETWFNQAVVRSPGDWLEPNAMTLSTSDLRGRVTSRIVLLKQHDADGFKFFTNYNSEKAVQLRDNPHASLLFHWAYLGRQVRIDGTVTKVPREISEEYFHSRPRGAQFGAIVSRQSEVLEDREKLREEVDEISQKLADTTIPLPDHWGGYRLKPDRFEFWQGRFNRLHDRVQYIIGADGGWSRRYLHP